MIDFRFLPLAEREMIEAALFYQEQAEGLGVEFLDDIERTINRLQIYPELGVVVTDTLRRSLLSRFPFSLFYTIQSEYILIMAVAHQRRRPGYWDERLTR